MIRSRILLERHSFFTCKIVSCIDDKLHAADEIQLKNIEKDKEYYSKLKDLTEKLFEIFK